MANDTDANIEATIRSTNSPEQDSIEQQAQLEAARPKQLYKLDPKTKVPVSYYEGQVWNSRRQAGLRRYEGLFESWDEAEAYYTNSQMEHRRATQGQSKGNDVVAKNRNRKFSSTENMVYSTVNSEIPSVYAKNPNIETTANDPTLEPIAGAIKHLANELAARADAPGVNLKPKIKKGVMRGSIMNEAWALIGYTQKDNSADQVREDIDRIAKELNDAKDAKTIEKLEGELMALEEVSDILDPAGPFVKSVRGDQVIVDPNSVEDDHSDANWKMVKMMMPTQYLNARYRQKKKGDNGEEQFVSAYKASHVVDARTSGSGVSEEQREIDNFHIFEAGKDNPGDYGYSSKEAYERAKMTAVWHCFDKVKRRFYLYADGDWTWPVWVFNDPYHLPNFFPLRKLMYHTDPKKNRTRGEVSHYLDQQDELNTISDEMNRMRTICRDKVLFDPEALDQATVENIFLDPTRKAVPVKGMSEGMDKKISPPPLPNLQFQHLWDRTPAMSVINQISGVGDAMRGEQFKTNTTNQAIEFYSSVSGVKLDEKRDAVEEWISGIMSDVVFLCLQFMPVETMIEVAGARFAPIFQSMPAELRDPKVIRQKLTIRVEGGSTQKPTSAAKKAEALQIGQILGQFGRTNPYASIVALRVMSRAFDSMTISKEEWDLMAQIAINASQQGGPAQGDEGQEQEAQEEEGAKREDQMVQELIARAKQRGQKISDEEARTAIRKRMNGGKQQMN